MARKTICTVHMDPDGTRAWAVLTGRRTRVPVSVDFDRKFKNPKQFRVPRKYRGRGHVYVLVGPRICMAKNPRGSRLLVRWNCAGPGGP